MQKATAVWLVEHTSLTFKQIADFCGLHILEIEGIADGNVAKGIMGTSPVAIGQLTVEEIKRCEANTEAVLHLAEEFEKMLIEEDKKRKKKGKYTHIAKRKDKPNSILWIIKVCPEMTNKSIARLLGSTLNTVDAIRNKTYWNYQELRSRDPVVLGLCSQKDLDEAIALAKSIAVANPSTSSSVATAMSVAAANMVEPSNKRGNLKSVEK